jgi:hypothetical protein
MKRKTITLAAILASLCLTTFTQAQGAVSANVSGSGTNHWAEGIYKEYSAATGGGITFQVQTLARKHVARLAGIALGDVLMAPPHRIVTTQVGTQLRDPQFYLADDPAYGRQELSETVDKFATVGLPLRDGIYRRLRVTATINGDVRQHEALEFCFAAENHCALLDPVVVFLQSKVENRQRLIAAGWAPRTKYGRALDETRESNLLDGSPDVIACCPGGGGGGGGGSDPCGLASNPSATYESTTWPAYTNTYTDIFGITLVQLSLAQQVAGMTCTTSCTPAPFATSDASSSFANIGYSAKCTNDGTIGTTGSSGKGIAESQCTYALAATASASVTIGDPDTASVTLNFNMSPSGGVSANGGSVLDTCGYY